MTQKKASTDMNKEQERAELHRTIWQIANNLRGSVDGWDFKQYVLGMLFYRFISENLTKYINDDERRAGKEDFDYSKLADKDAEFGRADTVKEKGFYILPSELFYNVTKNARNDPNLNETLAIIFKNIEGSAKGTESEDDLKGLFDDLDVNSNKLGGTVEKRNQQLVKLLESINGLRLGNYADNTIDAFGDAYEYLMTMYASNAGRSGGEFFTPQEVSELLAKIVTVGKKEVNKVYDPTCGSGSLLLKFAKVLGKEKVLQGFYGQESNPTTYNLCRINMFLHDINYEKFNIAHGDTLIDPKHWDDEPFDAIVSNPPYSNEWVGDSNPILINDPRFSPAGVLAPRSKADLAFTMHMLSWLSTSGVAAIVEYPGVLSRGGAEQKIRKYLVDNNYIDTIIQLPKDLFFGTTTQTCIIILKKSKNDNKILFIDASAEFIHPGNKNKLSEDNQKKILNAFSNREDIKHFVKIIDHKAIVDNDYDLSVSTYLEEEDLREVINISELNKEIEKIVVKQNKTRSLIKKIICDIGETPNKKPNMFDKLLNNRCLDGVEFRKLGEILDYEQPTPYIVSSTKYSDKFKTPVLTAGKGFIMGYTNETEGIYHASKEDPVIIFDDFTTSFHLVDFDFKIKSSAMKMIRPKENVEMDFKFVYFAMRCLDYKPKKHARHWISKYSLFAIPVPPLPVQKEIVKIIDNFTELELELKSELKAEERARKKQYEYYRGKLLTFKEKQE
jgi:type I restriction enzyme M protein